MKKFFQKIGAFLALVFGGAKKFEKFLQEHVDDAIAIVEKIKKAVENPLILTVIAILPSRYRNIASEVLARIESTL